MSELIQIAELFARTAHQGQFRFDRITPYINHPQDVVRLLETIGVRDEEIIASGWLHDVLEDCKVKPNYLEYEFGREVARIVGTLTRNCSREDYKKRIISSDYKIKSVKVADMVSNCKELYYGLPRKLIERKVNDANDTYLKLAMEVDETGFFYNQMKESVNSARKFLE